MCATPVVFQEAPLHVLLVAIHVERTGIAAEFCIPHSCGHRRPLMLVQCTAVEWVRGSTGSKRGQPESSLPRRFLSKACEPRRVMS